MTRARLDGMYFLLLGSVVFILLGLAFENVAKVPMQDFGVVYDPARCLIRQCDPYNESEVLRAYEAEKDYGPLVTANKHHAETRYIYFPTAFLVTVPFAMLPWGSAHILWMILTLGCLVFASFLIWDLGAIYAPIVSGVLIGFLLANSEVIVVLCNPAGIAISLCVVAVWCFFRERFIPVGILCLAVSLALKPQDAGLVWLYFLLAGGVYRKRALQTLLTVVVLCLPAVLWVWHVSPHWMQEWHSNVLAFSTHGGNDDTSLAALRIHGRAGVISLQAVVNAFSDDPRIYNPASYLVCGALLLAWAVRTLRSRFSQLEPGLRSRRLCSFHAVVLSSSLRCQTPAAHGSGLRHALGRGRPDWMACTPVDIPGYCIDREIFRWQLFLTFSSDNLHISTTGLSGQILTAVLMQPTPLILLAMGIFYLWIYHATRSGERPAMTKAAAQRIGVDTAGQRNFHLVGLFGWAKCEWVGGFQGSLLRHALPARTPQSLQGE